MVQVAVAMTGNGECPGRLTYFLTIGGVRQAAHLVRQARKQRRVPLFRSGKGPRNVLQTAKGETCEALPQALACSAEEVGDVTRHRVGDSELREGPQQCGHFNGLETWHGTDGAARKQPQELQVHDVHVRQGPRDVAKALVEPTFVLRVDQHEVNCLLQSLKGRTLHQRQVNFRAFVCKLCQAVDRSRQVDRVHLRQVLVNPCQKAVQVTGLRCCHDHPVDLPRIDGWHPALWSLHALTMLLLPHGVFGAPLHRHLPEHHNRNRESR
mmetsp:Transcript_25191/g.69245  ORF Transcript_25191/g.69245 Transcript_25191/m.69245 type:complete len:267 (+) Transcript_25191:995-1795(+)